MGFVSVFVSILLFVVGIASGSEATSELESVTLILNGETFELNKNAQCQFNNKPGVLSEKAHKQTWRGLVTQTRVHTLTAELIRSEVVEQMRQTRLVANADPAIVTNLILGFESSERKIVFSNVAIRSKAYPNASALSRLHAASQIMKTLADICDIGETKNL